MRQNQNLIKKITSVTILTCKKRYSYLEKQYNNWNFQNYLYKLNTALLSCVMPILKLYQKCNNHNG